MALTNPATLTAVRNISVPTQADLSWPYAHNNGYHIYRSENAGPFVLVKTIDPEVGFGQGGFGQGPFGQAYSVLTAWTDTTLSIASSYVYRINTIELGVDVAGGTSSGTINAFVIPRVDAGRRRFDTGVDLAWEPIGGASAFRVYRQVAGEPAFTFLVEIAAGSSAHNDASAPHLRDVQYQVTIVSGAVESPACTSNSVPADAPRAVSSLTATKAGKAINLLWTNTETPGAGVTGIRIYRITNGGDSTLVETLPSDASTSWTDLAANLAVGRRYRYVVAPFTTSGGESRAISNQESVNDSLSLLWSRGTGSPGDETFEVAKKVLPVFDRQVPVLKGRFDRGPVLRTKEAWAVVAPAHPATSYVDTSFVRSTFYAVSLRSRDDSANFSRRIVASVQG